ncbi:hypothetical protein EVAR_5404_1 [Eumeta japonica]|uniref:Uncharacterized protein n=1 Tax=Eumeta variegata TaxID=151549 RepID=A0A4C1TBM1_EUMVA|nr:hypothetical protein EVAR_5404_1 [Eumeta japonica]
MPLFVPKFGRGNGDSRTRSGYARLGPQEKIPAAAYSGLLSGGVHLKSIKTVIFIILFVSFNRVESLTNAAFPPQKRDSYALSVIKAFKIRRRETRFIYLLSMRSCVSHQKIQSINSTGGLDYEQIAACWYAARPLTADRHRPHPVRAVRGVLHACREALPTMGALRRERV